MAFSCAIPWFKRLRYAFLILSDSFRFLGEKKGGGFMILPGAAVG